MKNYIFTCKDCQYAHLTDGSQSDCKAGNLDILINSNSAALNPETGYYDLERVCLKKNDSEVKVGYLFILNSADFIDQLYTNVQLALQTGANWIGIVHESPEKGDEIIKNTNLTCKHFIAANYEKFDDVFKLDQPMDSYLNGWTIVNVAGEPFELWLKDELIKYTINNNPPVALIRNESESINGMTFFNMTYKFLKGSKPIQDQEKNVMHVKVYEEKISDMSPSMIKSWKEIYEVNNIIGNY